MQFAWVFILFSVLRVTLISTIQTTFPQPTSSWEIMSGAWVARGACRRVNVYGDKCIAAWCASQSDANKHAVSINRVVISADRFHNLSIGTSCVTRQEWSDRGRRSLLDRDWVSLNRWLTCIRFTCRPRDGLERYGHAASRDLISSVQLRDNIFTWLSVLKVTYDSVLHV